MTNIETTVETIVESSAAYGLHAEKAQKPMYAQLNGSAKRALEIVQEIISFDMFLLHEKYDEIPDQTPEDSKIMKASKDKEPILYVYKLHKNLSAALLDAAQKVNDQMRMYEQTHRVLTRTSNLISVYDRHFKQLVHSNWSQ